MTDGFRDARVCRRPPVLFSNILSLLLCLGVASAVRPHGRLVLLGGVLSLPGFLTELLDADYWNPVRVGRWAVGLEDALCAFDFGALALVPVVVLLRRSLSWEGWTICAARRSLLAGGALSALFLASMAAGLSPVTALITSAGLAAPGAAGRPPGPLADRPDRARRIPALVLPHRPALFRDVAGLHHPVEPARTVGTVVLGLPAGEIAWAIAFGALWPLFVGYVVNIRIAALSRRPDLAAPTGSGAATAGTSGC